MESDPTTDYPIARWPNPTTRIPIGESRVGQEVVDGAWVGVVVWDGAAPDISGGHTKGRLLALDGPSYVDSLTRLAHLAQGEKEDLDAETKAKKAKEQAREKRRVRRDESGKAGKNRAKG